jgi:hypothetical protein
MVEFTKGHPKYRGYIWLGLGFSNNLFFGVKICRIVHAAASLFLSSRDTTTVEEFGYSSSLKTTTSASVHCPHPCLRRAAQYVADRWKRRDFSGRCRGKSTV